MPHSEGLALLLVIAPITFFFYRTWENRRARRALVLQYGCQELPQYKHTDPVMGSDLFRLRQDAIKNGKLMALYESQFSTYGKTWEEKFLGTPCINTMHVDNIKHMATTAQDDFGRSTGGRPVAWPFMGKSITSTDGADWKHARAMVKPIFSRAELSDIDGLGIYMDRVISMISDDGESFDIQPLFHKMFVDISTEFAFGKSMDSLIPDTPFDSGKFFKALDRSLQGVLQRRQAGNIGIVKFLFDQEWKGAYEVVHVWIDDRVKEALESTSENIALDSQPQKYVLLREMAKEIRDPIELRYQVLGVFLPARDTTAILLSNALFHLARNPHLWSELRETALKIDLDKLTFESLKSLVDFRYLIHETLRLQRPSGRIQRTAVRDTILPRGGGKDGQSPVLVKKGTVVSGNVWGLHHDEDIWGPDTHVFNPQRWAGKRPLWEFIPFMGGPRICPANQQVLTYASYTLVCLTREFVSIETRDPVLEYVELTKMTTQSRNGVKIALRRSLGEVI